MLLYEVLPKFKCEYVCALILVVVLFFVCVCVWSCDGSETPCVDHM